MRFVPESYSALGKLFGYLDRPGARPKTEFENTLWVLHFWKDELVVEQYQKAAVDGISTFNLRLQE
jgi:hypothetical protein